MGVWGPDLRGEHTADVQGADVTTPLGFTQTVGGQPTPSLTLALKRSQHQHSPHVIRHTWIVELVLSDQAHLDTRIKQGERGLAVPLAEAGQLGRHGL